MIVLRYLTSAVKICFSVKNLITILLSIFRRRALLLSAIYLFVYGFLSSFSTSYGWILFLRFLVGFSIGCVPQSVTLFAEFLPTQQRAKCVVLMDCFWALGACLEVLLAALIMTSGGWR